MSSGEGLEIGSASEFITDLFNVDLADEDKYDGDVVNLVRTHLGNASMHPQAGVRLATELVKLAKNRAGAVNQGVGRSPK